MERSLMVYCLIMSLFFDVALGQSEESKITSISNAYPMFSPDNEKIVFHSNRMGNYDIYVMNFDGSDLIRLTDDPEMDRTPSWSPNGEKIAFVSTRDENYDVFVMDADGANEINLTQLTSSKEVHPYWSPDGSKIIFNSSRVDDTYDIYLMNADGSGLEKLRKNSDGEVIHAQYAPNGKKIVYRKFLEDGNSEIFIMDSDGNNELRLTNDPAFDFHPVVSPDGSSIIFSSSLGKSDEQYGRLYRMDMDGKNLQRISENNLKEADLTPVWTRDGEQIFFSRWSNEGTVDIYSLRNIK